MPRLPGWSPLARDGVWVDLLIVSETDGRTIEDLLRRAIEERALRFHNARRRDLDRLTLPPMPAVFDLAWQDDDDLLVSRLRSRFTDVPIVAVTEGWDEPLSRRLVQAGADHCVPREALDSPMGRQLIEAVLAVYKARQEAAELARRYAEATSRFTHMIENNVDGMVIIDFAGTVRYANAAAHKLFGLPDGQLIGRGFGSPVAEAAAQIELMQPNGEARLVEMRVTNTVWNQQPMRLAALRDITGRILIAPEDPPHGRRGWPLS